MARATPPAGLPVLRPSPSSTRATAITPAEAAGVRVARFPTADSLPRERGGSASASLVSRPSRRSLALRPEWSLSRPRRAPRLEVLQTMSLPPSSAPIATGWSDSCRAGFAPAERWRLLTAHPPSRTGRPGVHRSPARPRESAHRPPRPSTGICRQRAPAIQAPSSSPPYCPRGISPIRAFRYPDRRGRRPTPSIPFPDPATRLTGGEGTRSTIARTRSSAGRPSQPTVATGELTRPYRLHEVKAFQSPPSPR